MRLRPISSFSIRSGVKRARAAFTLAEALAAMAFLAIVIPVAMEALHLASHAGVVAQRKALAARFADRWLNELLVTGQWKQGGSGGTTDENGLIYRWQLRSDSWERDALKRLTLSVTYTAQGREYQVELATLMDPNAP